MTDTKYSAEKEKIIHALKDRNLTAVAKGSGLHPNTVRYLARGTRLVSKGTLAKLSAYLFKE